MNYDGQEEYLGAMLSLGSKSLSIPPLLPSLPLFVSEKLKKLIDNASRTLVNLPFSLRGAFEFHHVDGTNGCLTEVTACTVV